MKGVCLVGRLLLGWAGITSAASATAFPARVEKPNPPRENSGCGDLLPADAVPRKPVDARTLARMRDIGTVRDYSAGSRPMALSPDRSRVAFVLQRAVPDRNAYCFALVVLPIRQGGVPLIVDAGGELITIRDNYLGMADFPTGAQATVEPEWAPDGRSIAFLRRDNGITQLWQAFVDGRPARLLTRSSSDVDRPAWSQDGRSIVYRTRPDLVAAKQAIDAEGRRGYLYDWRLPALGSAKPLPPANIPYVWMTLRLDDAAADTASGAERGALTGMIGGTPANAVMATRSGRRTAWAEPVQPDALLPFFRLEVRIAGRNVPCTSDVCAGDLKGIWWLSDGRLIFSRSEGVGNGELAFYRWIPGISSPRRILKSDALYVSCQPLTQGLVCLRETPTRPRAIVVLNAESGGTTTIFDPNPEITGAPHGRVERLTWNDARGGTTFGYLILPPGYAPGQKIPLIVVQYWAKGFQRGGVGDEVPAFPLANQGFAILSFDRPRNRTALIRNHNDDDYMREALRDWKDRRDVLASLESGVKLLIDRGIVDPARVGLTGLSDGAETTQFALINSTMFTAASLGTCCKDPLAFTALAGPAQWAAQERWGLRPWTTDSRVQWQAASLALNADRITTPILLQLSDWEFRMSVQTVAEFQRLGRPLELRVFPAEYHIKTQPAHRLALYERNIEWFSRWFKPSWLSQPQPMQ